MHPAIKRLSESLPPFLTIDQYCEITGRSRNSVYTAIRANPDIAVKVGGATRLITAVVLAQLLPWRPQKERAGAPKNVAPPPKKSARRRGRAAEVRP